jgi:hypothetical protein
VIGEHVVRKLAYGDVGQWRRPDVQQFVGLLGWELDAASRILVGGVVAGRVVLTPERLDRFGFGECCRIEVAAAFDPDDYRDTLTTAATVLGPPTVVGGPGARAMWRLPDRNVTFDVSGLSVEPREPAEARDYFDWEWDAEYEPPFRWALQPTPDDELFFTGWPPAADWDEFASMVRAVFGALAFDVPLLAPYTRTIIWNISFEDRYVQGWFAPDECHLETPTAHDLPTTAKNGIPGLTVESGVASLGERVADLAVTTIRSWNLATPADLTHRAWSNRPGSRLIVFGI